MSPPVVGLEEALARAHALADGGHRRLLGIAGPPGAGKSTLAAFVAREVANAVVVPLDGFHLADVQLDRLGRRDRKGAEDTFDVWGYLALIKRLRDQPEPGSPEIFAPAFERTLEQPIAGSIAVSHAMSLVVTEGNYLLLDSQPWLRIATALHEIWFVDSDPVERRRRLVARHVEFGKQPDAAERWVSAVDDVNARRVGSARQRADLIVRPIGHAVLSSSDDL